MSVLERSSTNLQSIYEAVGRIRSRLNVSRNTPGGAPPYIRANPVQAEADLRWCLDVLEKILRKASKGLSSPGV